ncbi:MAG: putative Zn-dependent peptidase [Bacteroidetes bacterium]|nr:MAG: putative Zn-dependent peptidase [Bacteroidota bacterium]
MSLNRSIQPEFRQIEEVNVPRAKRVNLSNGIPVWMLNAGTQELARIEFLFCAGTRDQAQPLQATAANDMLDEGTKSRTAQEIAETLDFFGAFIESEVQQDYASFTLFTLNKHLGSTLAVVEDILKNAAFPENEFHIYISNRKQKFLVDSEKVGTVARREFSPLLFGETHPYGGKATLEDFDKLNCGTLADFHKKYYTSRRASIVISGKVDESHIAMLEKHFGGTDWAGAEIPKEKIAVSQSHKQREHTIVKDGAIQSAIRMGRVLFNKTHADYHGINMLNTVLGGYFASRLNANIREDKGFTYGIGSGLVSLWDAGYMVIATEVGADVCTAALNEIYVEMARLQTELISESELDLVRNYMAGTFLRSTDGPFALADRLKGLIGYGLDYEYYNRYMKTIRTTSAEDLRELARKYLDKEDFVELVVGKR